MPFNVLLLPLLGGYVFVAFWNYTRFTTKRYSGERLLFHAALAGVVFLVIAFVLTRLIAWQFPGAWAWWHKTVPFDYAGTSLGALLLGSTVWAPLNALFFPREKEAQRAIQEWNDYLEVLLDQAVRETRQVAITLKGRKIYVGFIVRVFDPAYERKYISILPVVSGYRDEEKLNVVFDTDYANTYQEMIAREASRIINGVEDFQVILPVAEIQSASLFDWDAYYIFNADEPDAPDPVNPAAEQQVGDVR